RYRKESRPAVQPRHPQEVSAVDSDAGQQAAQRFTLRARLMRDSTIARNYAETLLSLADRADEGAREDWGKQISDIAQAIRGNLVLRRFLESPRISEDAKREVLLNAFGDRVPAIFLRFLQILV